jgi:hypothetical protein
MLFFTKKELEERGDWLLYSEQVRKQTEQTFKTEYIENKELRGKGWVLDHKLSVKEAYLQGVPPDMVSHVCNLQMVPKEYNSSKGARSSISFTELIEMVTDHEDY